MKGFDAERVKGFKVIGINEAGLTLVPWCDILFWGDQRWYDWNKDRLHLHTGAMKIHRHSGYVPGAMRIRYNPPAGGGIHWGKDAVGGIESGSSAINLALHTGASKIVLLGFDMMRVPLGGQNNFHDKHQASHNPDAVKKFIRAHRSMAGDLKSRGHPVKVMNATTISGLVGIWPMVDLEDILRAYSHLRS